MRVAVILPSRGLMFSQTADEILQNLKGIPHKIYFAHKLPIPDCFEVPTNRALDDPEVTHLWFVEDDMVFKPDCLKKMLELDKAVVTADYPTTEYGGGAVFKLKGQIIWGGTGCTLVKRAVFDELKKPYFRTDICWNIKNFGDFFKLVAIPRGEVDDGYGLHDVNFYINLYRLGIPVHDAGFKVAQRKLKALGKAGTNNGAHQIDLWKKIKRDDLLKKAKKWPIEPRGSLTPVVINGREILTSAAHARKLIRKGMAVKPPRRAIVIDDTEIL